MKMHVSLHRRENKYEDTTINNDIYLLVRKSLGKYPGCQSPPCTW